MNISALKIFTASLFLNLAIIVLPSHAAPGDVDPSFDPGSGIDGSVSSIAVQPDGKLVITGSFRTVEGLVRPGLARLNADGSGDATFNPGPAANDVFGHASLQPDGKVLVTGNFTTANGLDRTGVARLNPDGSRDGSFNSTIGPIGASNSGRIAVQPDGKVLVGGIFTTADG